jgi:hypothetical protein
MAAIANAVHNALGKWFYSSPMPPPKVFAALEAGGDAARLSGIRRSPTMKRQGYAGACHRAAPCGQQQSRGIAGKPILKIARLYI